MVYGDRYIPGSLSFSTLAASATSTLLSGTSQTGDSIVTATIAATTGTATHLQCQFVATSGTVVSTKPVMYITSQPQGYHQIVIMAVIDQLADADLQCTNLGGVDASVAVEGVTSVVASDAASNANLWTTTP